MPTTLKHYFTSNLPVSSFYAIGMLFTFLSGMGLVSNPHIVSPAVSFLFYGVGATCLLSALVFLVSRKATIS